MEAVNLEAFERSAAALRRALALFEAHRHGELAVMSRNSVILEFEICFGQMRSPLERCLIRLDAVPPEEVRTMSYPMLMRSAAQHGYTRVDWED